MPGLAQCLTTTRVDCARRTRILQSGARGLPFGGAGPSGCTSSLISRVSVWCDSIVIMTVLCSGPSHRQHVKPHGCPWTRLAVWTRLQVASHRIASALSSPPSPLISLGRHPVTYIPFLPGKKLLAHQLPKIILFPLIYSLLDLPSHSLLKVNARQDRGHSLLTTWATMSADSRGDRLKNEVECGKNRYYAGIEGDSDSRLRRLTEEARSRTPPLGD